MKYAYLTCELVGRDLDSRLLIAAQLIKRGVSCIVGQQWAMFANMQTAPTGTFLFKTANKFQGTVAAECKRAGHKVVVSDEEVLALIDAPRIVYGTDRGAVQNADVFLALDENHKALVESVAPVKCEVVGNARVDLLLSYPEVYRAEANKNRAAGPYILFNTNFAMTNSVWESVDTAFDVTFKARGMDPESQIAKERRAETIKFEQANRALMLSLLQWVRQKFDYRIVVRPHPAERFQTWAAMPGIEVVPNSNPIPWLLGAELMIHSNSTTGFEGALVGTPCLNLNPLKDSMLGKAYLMSDANHTVQDAAAAVEAMDEFLTHRRGPLTEIPRPRMVVGAAEKTAEIIASLTPDVAELKSWGQHQSKQRQIDKFDVSPKEFNAKVETIFGLVGVRSVQIAQLGRALFLIV